MITIFDHRFFKNRHFYFIECEVICQMKEGEEKGKNFKISDMRN